MPKVIDGIGLMTQGNYYKGLQAIAPTGIANLVKAGELYNKGIVKRNGDVVLSPDEVSTFDVMSQALGLPSSKITDKRFVINAEYESEKFYKDRTTELKTDYVEAFKKGDRAKLEEIRKEWEQTQIARVKNGLKRQPYSELFMAPQEKAKREKEIRGGISKPSLASGITER
jgi:hypothetical protein